MKNLEDLADLCPTMLVAQFVMSATDTLGYGMYVAFLISATDPHPRQWISIHTRPKDASMLL